MVILRFMGRFGLRLLFVIGRILNVLRSELGVSKKGVMVKGGLMGGDGDELGIGKVERVKVDEWMRGGMVGL